MKPLRIKPHDYLSDLSTELRESGFLIELYGDHVQANTCTIAGVVPVSINDWLTETVHEIPLNTAAVPLVISAIYQRLSGDNASTEAVRLIAERVLMKHVY